MSSTPELLIQSTEMLNALADALVAAADVLRKRAAAIAEPPRKQAKGGVPRHIQIRRAAALRESQSEQLLAVLETVRREHPSVGERQVELMSLLTEAGDEGATTGDLSRRMEYDQANVYLTARQLARRGFVEKDNTARPHRYRLAERFRGT